MVCDTTTWWTYRETRKKGEKDVGRAFKRFERLSWLRSFWNICVNNVNCFENQKAGAKTRFEIIVWRQIGIIEELEEIGIPANSYYRPVLNWKDRKITMMLKRNMESKELCKNRTNRRILERKNRSESENRTVVERNSTIEIIVESEVNYWSQLLLLYYSTILVRS